MTPPVEPPVPLPAAFDATAHVFADRLDDRITVAGDDGHHLQRARRVRAGETVTVADGHGRWRVYEVVRSSGGEVELDALTLLGREPPLVPRLTVACSLTKGQKPELAVQKLTELGVDRIVPFVAARSVVRWDDARSARQAERLERVAREAAMQCRRCHLPELTRPTTFEAVAGEPGVVLAERGGRPPDRTTRVVLVGPEGGWTEDERRSVSGHVGFGPHVLRSETAAVAVAAVLGALRAGVVIPRVDT